MNTSNLETSPRRYALLAGIAYLVIIAAGIFAEFFVRSSLIVAGDAAATANNIIASEWLFRLGIASDMVMLLCDVIVALALYVLFRSVSRNLALLAAFLRLVHAAIYGGTLLNLFHVLQVLSGAEYLSVFKAGQIEALALFFLNEHSTGYLIGLVFFGVNCLVTGYLILKSGWIPKILGYLLMIAGIGYLTDSFAQILMLDYSEFADVFIMVVFIPAFIAELSFCFWLIFKGGKRNISGIPVQ